MKQEIKSIVVVGGVLTVALIFLIISLSYRPVSPMLEAESGTFNSIEEIQMFLERHSNSGAFSYGGIGRDTVVAQESESAPGAVNDAGVKGETSAGAGDYSQTNIQVKGVDEADIVKNDGKYIYTLSGSKVVIVEAYPAENMGILDEIEFKDESPMNIFINDERLIVFTQKYEYVDTGLRCGEVYWGVRCGGYSRESTKAYIYDVSDRSNAELVKTISFNGNYVNARMIEDYVYLISNKYIQINSFDMPFYEVDGVKMDIAPGKIRYFNQDDENFVFNTIAAIDVRSGDFDSETFLMGASTNIYVSTNNVYLTYQKTLSQEYIIGRYLDEVLLPELPRNVAGRIGDVWEDNDRTLREKERDISGIFESYMRSLTERELFEFQNNLEDKAFAFFEEIQEMQQSTIIQRITINGLDISHEASGSVSGRVLNQFSMDEYDDSFRIATTTGGWNRDKNKNNLYVLDMDLKEIGKIEGLAEGEQIYSVRFMGEKAYMVTFRQTDPLFAIDLSDARNPRVLGELKVTGYSGYLHPYDENHLLGIGMEASEDGRVQGVKISLFDVSDMENPREIGKYEVMEKWSNSEAVYEHKAVLFDKEKKLLVIPVSYSKEYSVAGQSWPRYENWQGAYVFDVDLEGIFLKGTVVHESDEDGNEYWYGGGNYVRRSLYIGDILYTLSNSKIKANSLDDLNEISALELPYKYGYGPIYYARDGVVAAEPAL